MAMERKCLGRGGGWKEKRRGKAGRGQKKKLEGKNPKVKHACPMSLMPKLEE